MAQGSAKVNLSKQHRRAAASREYILTKNEVIADVYALFGRLAQRLSGALAFLPEELRKSNAKISRGENYQGMPWVMLDCPAVFGKQKIFAVRSFFWWGHSFGVHLLLQGPYKDIYGEAAKKLAIRHGWRYCVAETMWDHHFEKANYIKANAKNLGRINEHQLQHDFVKIATKLPLKNWNKLEAKLNKVIDEMAGTAALGT